MCVVSMIMDHFHDQWKWRQPDQWKWRQDVPQPVPAITPQEVEEFRKLLERAREYDRRNNQPDCELEAKRRRLLELADELGVKIDFV